MKTPDEFPVQGLEMLHESFSTRKSRRSLLKVAAAGVAGMAAAGVGGAALLAPKGKVHASGGDTEGAETSIKQIFSIAATAERLAITFYTNGVKNFGNLGIRGVNADNIEAALIEEQIHELFFVANGGVPLTSTFSFPHGPATFTNLRLFIETQQQLEVVFDSAFLAAIKEFAYLGQPRLAQIAGQISDIEAEHRVLGRQIGAEVLRSNAYVPADNFAFSPVFLESVSDAPALVASAGYLSPKPGNTYTYHQVSTADENILYRFPFTVGEDND